MSESKIKANWEDSSDEEDNTCSSASEAVASEAVASEEVASEAVASPSIGTTTINRCDCFACISDSYEIEKYISETGFPPQCENKLEAEKQYDEDEGYDEDDEGYAEDDEDDGYEEDEYDDACDMVDKKMGNYVRCR